MTKADSAHSTTAPARRRKPKFTPRPDDIGSETQPYAMLCAGDCMAPEIADGAPIVCDPAAPVRTGDLVVIWIRPEFVVAGGDQAIVRRLVMGSPHTQYPFNPHPESEVAPVILVETNKPARQFTMRCEKIAAIHRCLGQVALVDGSAVVPPGLLEEARRGDA